MIQEADTVSEHGLLFIKIGISQSSLIMQIVICKRNEIQTNTVMLQRGLCGPTNSVLTNYSQTKIKIHVYVL